ncbi:MAG: hypothetical protein ACLPLR_06125 [Terriglobales bacterium]
MRELTEKEWKRIEDVCPYDHEGHANYSIPCETCERIAVLMLAVQEKDAQAAYDFAEWIPEVSQHGRAVLRESLRSQTYEDLDVRP